jgi:hypothetical protein
MSGLDATLTTAIRDARGLVLESTSFQVKIPLHKLPTSRFDEIE